MKLIPLLPKAERSAIVWFVFVPAYTLMVIVTAVLMVAQWLQWWGL